MKFGFRKPSLKKRIAARTSVKRMVRHSLGLKAPKGYGWLTNPKKAAYNRVYNRTTTGCMVTILVSLSIVALTGILISGCSIEQSYRYVRIEKVSDAENGLIERVDHAETIKAVSDSAAYLIALEKFTVWYKAHVFDKKDYSRDFHFRLFNKDSVSLDSVLQIDSAMLALSKEKVENILDPNRELRDLAKNSTIPNLHPTDVYVSMEKLGFKTSKNLSKDYGNTEVVLQIGTLFCIN